MPESNPQTVMVHRYEDLCALRGRRSFPLEVRDGEFLSDLVKRICELEQLGDVSKAAVLVDGESYDPLLSAIMPPVRRWSEPIREISIAPMPGTGVDIVLIIVAIASAVASAVILSSVSAPAVTGSNDPEQRRFGFNRFSNEAVAGDLIPTVFGRRRRYGGKVIAKIPREGPDGDQKVKMLVALGNGPINKIGSRLKSAGAGGFNNFSNTGITDIFLNDQPLSSFPSVRVWGRYGTSDQRSIPGFRDTEVLREVGVGGVALVNTSGSNRTGTDDAEAFLFTTGDIVDFVTLRVRFQRGLYQVSAAGQIGTVRVQYRYRWRVHAGPGAWSAFTTVTLERADQSEVISAERTVELGGAGSTPVVYDIQVQRVTKDATDAKVVDLMLLDAVVETRESNNTYADQSLIALDLTASEQLSTIPRVSVDVEGYAELRVWDGVSSPSSPTFTTGYSANPAAIALELIVNKVFGMGADYDDSNVDLVSLFEWWAYCDENVARVVGGGTRKRFVFNDVYDTDEDPFEYLRKVCAAGRCVPMLVGNVWRFIVDRPQPTPVEVFTDGDICVDENGQAEFTYKRVLVKGPVARDVPNQLICQFENELQAGQSDVMVHPADGELWLGGGGGGSPEPVRRRSFKLEGVTDPEQVMSELIYRLDKMRGLSRTVKFRTAKPAVRVQPGERFDLAMSLPGWGKVSGRVYVDPLSGLAPAEAGLVRLDRSVTLAPDTTYTIRVRHLDNTVDVRTVASTAGTYAAGAAIAVTTAFSQVPAEFAAYALGESGVEAKPFIATRVAPVIKAGQGITWEIEGLEYDAAVYDDIPGNVDLPTYTDLKGIATPPGPLKRLDATERISNGLRVVELSYVQEPADREITITFRAYRREVGTQTWILTPGVTSSLRSTVIEISDLDRAYQFVVVAVSPIGAALSPYDPRHPIANIVYGLSAPPLPPPTELTITHVGGNTYRLDWTAVEGAAGYQVLSGAEPGTGLPNDGCEDALVIARTPAEENFLTGLELPSGQSVDFWVRTVSPSGRLSWTAVTAQIDPVAVPGGMSVVGSPDFDLDGTGTKVNLVWNGTDSRLELDNPTDEGSWTSDVQTTGYIANRELMVKVRVRNDADDPALNTDPFRVPSIQADQWGVIEGEGDTAVVGMLMPPWPDDEHGYFYEARTSGDGSLWSAWEAIGPVGPDAGGAGGGYRSIERLFRDWQIRLRLKRKNAPYRVSVAGVVAVLAE